MSTTLSSSTSLSSPAAIVGEISTLLPIVGMLAGTHLQGVGTAVVTIVNKVADAAKAELVSLKAELDSGANGAVTGAALKLIPGIETLTGVPGFDETKLFASLSAAVDAVHAAVMAL